MSSTPQLEDGFTMLANELMESVLGFGFSHREQSVVFTIFRKTYGYGKKEDDMSASQIGAMCGITRQHVTTTLNLLALRNVINKRPGRFGSIISIQKDHRKWVATEQMKALPPSPELGRVDSPESGQGGEQGVALDGAVLVPNKDTCPESGLVPNKDATSPDSGQVDSPESGHTKENLPKENHQKKTPCAPQAERDSADDPPAGKKQRRAMTGASQELQDRFDRFYAAYPRKKSRLAAEKAFAKLNPDEQLMETIFAGLERAMKSGDWRRGFIPHPASWINNGGWMDEIQTAYDAEELAVIQLFNDVLGDQLGTVSEALFDANRAAAIRDFKTFSDKPDFIARVFPWVLKNADLPPHVGFDWLISRVGFDKATGGQHTRKAA
jgi:phage replication O-like protein O